MKKLITFVCALSGILQLSAQTINIVQSGGWMESAFVKWTPVSGVDSYNVYYTGGNFTDKLIDTQLVRNYGSYFRADAVGLSPGTYTMKIVPVTNNVEGTPVVSGGITVTAHDRNGFAHANSRVPGAYNLDGTLKSNAVVLYITQDTKNTVSLNVTGANANPCVGLQTILDGFKKGYDTRPLVVRFIGNITDPSYTLNGDLVVENNKNASSYITLEGIGNDALINGFGIRLKSSTNVEVRNLGYMLTNADEGDNLSLQQDNSYIWAHNNDLFYGAPGSDADQAKGDGALDCKKSTNVTFSYNHFWDSGKSCLLGLSEGTNTDLYITYHHNWFDHSDSRHPRVRYYSAHVYNNYFDGNSKYGIGSTMGSSIFAEGNYFRNCKYPMMISKQGTDISGGSTGTFSGENGGIIKAYNNYMIGQTAFVPYSSTNTTQFDAYVATTRSEALGTTITALQGGGTYNNFDTNAALYINSLTIDDPTTARDKTTQFSGRMNGGDISWTFNNSVDDTSYAVNAGLMAVLQGYTSGLVSVQGITSAAASSQTLVIPTNNDQTVVTGSAMAPVIFTWGGTATDVTVTGLPASGLSFVKNTTDKTVTVSGVPTADVAFTVATTGSTGTSVSGTGEVTVVSSQTPAGNQIHNFTASVLSSTFYTFSSANMNSTDGSASYDGLTLTKRLKIESATGITYTTPSTSTLTLVFDPTFTGTIKLDNVSYTASAGIVTVPNVAAGAHSISKGSVANLFYIKTEYNAGVLATKDLVKKEKIYAYPNPAVDFVNISNPENDKITEISVVNSSGQTLMTMKDHLDKVDVRALKSGVYFIVIKTSKEVKTLKIIKK